MNEEQLDPKTIYSIIDENGEKSSITLEKWVSDYLVELVPDVHLFVQEIYNKVVQKKPELPRRIKGNYVRMAATKKATEHPQYKEFISLL